MDSELKLIMEDQADILKERDNILADIDLIKENVTFMTE
jgi:hypothetical protein